jgi:ribosomal protein S12 methylthiotransferase
MNRKQLCLISLGCPKNTVDSEKILNRLFNDNFDFVTDPGKADAVIVNTCGFIKPAMDETEKTFHEMLKIKKKKKHFMVIGMGCAITRYEKELKEKFPGIDGLFPLGRETEIEKLIYLNHEPSTHFNDRKISIVLPHYAYLKIAEGCSRFCTFCTIPAIRGEYKSRTMEELVKEAGFLAKRGVRELILIAQDTTVYGKDIYGRLKLIDLLKQLEDIQGIEWIRVLYAYPEHINKELLDHMISSGKILHYLDLPIQHAHPDILKKMGRAGTFDVFDETFRYLRKACPDFCLRTTVITGFPGETEEHFQYLTSYIKEMQFDKLGVFTYYNEKGTKAYSFENKLPQKEIEKRRNYLMLEQQKIVFEKNKQLKGKIFYAIIEGQTDEGGFVGRSYRDAPDIDTFIEIESGHQLLSGDIVKVKITGFSDYDLIGEVVNA